MFYVLKNLKSKITLANWLFIIPAIIHFLLVIVIQYKLGELNVRIFDNERLITFIIVKILTFCLIIGFYQLILAIIKGFKNNNSTIKQITKYFLIYFIPNLILFILIFPGIHTICSYGLTRGAIDYDLSADSDLNNLLCIFFQMIAYNIIPSASGISLCNIFLYSIIIAYIVYNLTNNCNYKYAALMFLPFLFPHILLLNTYPFAVIYSSWMFILLFSLILIAYKTQKYKCNTLFVAILAILSSILTVIRNEFAILIILLPLMIYFLKIFDKKRYFIFIFCFYILFSLLFLSIYYEKQKLGNDMYYELHNTSILSSHIPGGILNKITEDEKSVILNTYFESDGYLSIDNFNLQNKINAKYATYIILKTIIKHSPMLIKEGFNRYKNYNGGAIFQEEENLFFHYTYKPIPTKIIDYLTLPNSSYFVVWNKIMSNPIIYYVLLGIIFILGFIYKNYFYVWLCLTFLFLHSLLLLIVPFYAYLYIYPCYIVLYWIFILFILEIIKFVKEKIN